MRSKRGNTNKHTVKSYTVERIIGYRHNRILSRNEYLVKWEGYPIEQSTWQPLNDLDGCLDALKDFLKEIKRNADDESLKIPDSDGESELVDLPFIHEDNKIKRTKRVFPKNEDSGIAKGWKIKRIIGFQQERKSPTFYVEYVGKRRREHINVDYLHAKYPEMVKKFDESIVKLMHFRMASLYKQNAH